jgi:hypothetical protein
LFPTVTVVRWLEFVVVIAGGTRLNGDWTPTEKVPTPSYSQASVPGHRARYGSAVV